MVPYCWVYGKTNWIGLVIKKKKKKTQERKLGGVKEFRGSRTVKTNTMKIHYMTFLKELIKTY